MKDAKWLEMIGFFLAHCAPEEVASELLDAASCEDARMGLIADHIKFRDEKLDAEKLKALIQATGDIKMVVAALDAMVPLIQKTMLLSLLSTNYPDDLPSIVNITESQIGAWEVLTHAHKVRIISILVRHRKDEVISTPSEKDAFASFASVSVPAPATVQ